MSVTTTSKTPEGKTSLPVRFFFTPMWRAWGSGPRSFVSAAVFKLLYFPLAAPVVLGALLLIVALLLVLTTTALVIFVATALFAQLTRLLGPIAAQIPWPQRGAEPIPNAATAADPVNGDPASDPDVSESTLLRILGLRNTARYYDAVFEGGGVKAIGQIGAVEVFEQHQLVPRYLAGTSGGAIIAAALAVGGSSREMTPIISSGDLTEYLDSRLLPNQPALRHLLYGISPMLATAVRHYGAVRGDAFLDMIRRELRAMYNTHNPNGRALGPDDDVNFDDLRFPKHHDDLEQCQRLRIVATDITRRKALQFPKDLSDYKRIESGPLIWTAGQGFPIALAVRMSMAIPALFEPVRAIDTDDVLCHIVDGGVSSNYPIWLFDSVKPPTAPTFGFLLDEKKGTDANPAKPVKHFLGFAMGVIGSGIGAIDRILSDHNNARTIRIGTSGVGTADFDLEPQQRARLLEAGRSAAREHLDQFDWHRYVAKFRGNVVGIPAYENHSPPSETAMVYQVRD